MELPGRQDVLQFRGVMATGDTAFAGMGGAGYRECGEQAEQ